MLQAVAADTVWFQIVLFSVLSGFGLAFRVLHSNADLHSYSSIQNSMWTTYIMGTFGQFDYGEFNESSNPLLTFFLFFVLQQIVLIIMMNSLIAIMSDTFERMQDKSALTLTLLRAQLIQVCFYSRVRPQLFALSCPHQLAVSRRTVKLTLQ